jgi:OOP family OmpA-OmpF porin
MVLGCAFLFGCARREPPRPVPPPENVPELPPWFPEKAWNEEGANDDVFFHGKVVFNTAKHTLRPQSEKVLQELLTYLNANPDISRIRLEGHTDSRAEDDFNQGLSERRAIVVADWLVDRGLDHTRILAVAFGETRPLAPNDSAAGRQENRRTAFDPAEVAGRRFDDKDPTNGGLVLAVLSKAERDALKRKGVVPTFTAPPVKVERDIFKPLEKKKKLNEKELSDKLLGNEQPTIDASTGKVKTDL